jgi:hypothetical protein
MGEEAAPSIEPATQIQRPAEANECLLLRNGNVLAGRILRQGDDYIVQRDGATLHLAAHQVEAVCADLPAAYSHRRRSVDPHDAATHLRLADWCLQQGLLDAAELELAEAGRLEPMHPRLPIVQTRLAVAREPTRLALSASREDNSQSVATAVAVGQSAALAAANVQTDRDPLAGYPNDTMEKFRRGIQPLLLNSCTTSGCHSRQGAYSFVLDRRALWHDAPRELTIANLASVLDRINRDMPRQSRLLAAAAAAHAPSLAASPLSVESPGFTRLSEWVMHVSGRDAPKVEEAEAVPPPQKESAVEADEVEISDEELDALLPDEDAGPLRARRLIPQGLLPAPRIAESD